METEIAVTGIGLVTPAGVGTAESWRGVCEGRSVAAVDPELVGNPIRLSCRVPGFDAESLLGGRLARRLDRFAQLAVVAAREAVADAGVDPGSWDGARVGVVVGCADGGPGTTEQQHRIFLERAPDQVSPLLLPMRLPNMVAGQLAIEFGARGPNMVITTACASGATAIGVARDLLTLGRCDLVLSGGTESMITPLVMAGFARMGALSARQDDPMSASRPFDRDRDGFVAAEGAAILVLERRSDARARGARCRGLVIGFGASADAHHVTSPQPDGHGTEQALRTALADADVAADDVEHVNAHGTSTPVNDVVEAGVLHRVLGDRPLVTSTKGVTGHMLGAAGAAEVAFTVLAVQQGVVPPTANLTEQDADVHLRLATTATASRPRLAVSNSAGFGGQNAVVVVAAA